MLLIVCPGRETQSHAHLQQLWQLKSGNDKLWIHVILDHFCECNLSPVADSVSVDLAEHLGLLQPMAVTLVSDCSYLKKALTDDLYRQLAPLKNFFEGKVLEGYNAMELSLEMSRPARSVVLWFVLNTLGFQQLNT